MTNLEIVAAFQDIPSGNVSDAMLNLGIPIGAICTLHRASESQKRLVGIARTIKQMQRHQAAEGKSLTKHQEVINNDLKEGEVLVFDCGGRTDVVTGGAMLALRAKMRGCTGFVVNGALRDTDEIKTLDFPVHLAGNSPVKSAPNLQTIASNIPVEIDGTQILPGDLLVGDDSGIVVVPSSKIEEVLAEAQAIKAKEAGIVEMVAKGGDFFDAARKNNL